MKHWSASAYYLLLVYIWISIAKQNISDILVRDNSIFYQILRFIGREWSKFYSYILNDQKMYSFSSTRLAVLFLACLISWLFLEVISLISCSGLTWTSHFKYGICILQVFLIKVIFSCVKQIFISLYHLELGTGISFFKNKSY